MQICRILFKILFKKNPQLRIYLLILENEEGREGERESERENVREKH